MMVASVWRGAQEQDGNLDRQRGWPKSAEVTALGGPTCRRAGMLIQDHCVFHRIRTVEMVAQVVRRSAFHEGAARDPIEAT